MGGTLSALWRSNAAADTAAAHPHTGANDGDGRLVDGVQDVRDADIPELDEHITAPVQYGKPGSLPPDRGFTGVYMARDDDGGGGGGGSVIETCPFRRGKRHGRHLQRHCGGAAAGMHANMGYCDGEKHGAWWLYGGAPSKAWKFGLEASFAGGQTEVRERQTWLHGELHGLQIAYESRYGLPDGVRHYRRGKLHGHQFYMSNGSLRAMCAYDDGVLLDSQTKKFDSMHPDEQRRMLHDAYGIDLSWSTMTVATRDSLVSDVRPVRIEGGC